MTSLNSRKAMFVAMVDSDISDHQYIIIGLLRPVVLYFSVKERVGLINHSNLISMLFKKGGKAINSI